MAANQQRFRDDQSHSTPRVRLQVSNGPSGGNWSEVATARTLRVGRSVECTLRVFDPRMSRRHFEAFFAQGRWWLNDLGSSNGTSINDQKVQDPVELRGGEVIVAGDTQFEVSITRNRFHRQDSPSKPSPHDVSRQFELANRQLQTLSDRSINLDKYVAVVRGQLIVQIYYKVSDVFTHAIFRKQS